MYIDYVITTISTSNFYVSKTTGEATLKHVGADAPTIFLEFSVNYLVFTSNAPPKPNYLHPPPRPTLAAPLHFALASLLSKTSVSTSISPMTRQMPLCHSAPRAHRSSTCLCPAMKPSTCRHTTRTGPDRGRIGGSGARGLVGSGDSVPGEGGTDFIVTTKRISRAAAVGQGIVDDKAHHTSGRSETNVESPPSTPVELPLSTPVDGGAPGAVVRASRRCVGGGTTALGPGCATALGLQSTVEWVVWDPPPGGWDKWWETLAGGVTVLYSDWLYIYSISVGSAWTQPFYLD
jgi:hypothetical protein